MTPDAVKQPPEEASKLRAEISRIRLRARATLLLEAFLAAVAADLLYDLVGLGVFLLTGKGSYFPPFLLVIFTVLALYAIRKTRFSLFSRDLDRQHRLKERLTAAEAYRLSERIPDEIVAAQARESLAAIDFPGIRKTFRPRLAAHLGAIALLAGITGAIAWQFPRLFTPRSFFPRQGRQFVATFSHRNSIEEMMAEARRQGGSGETPGTVGEPGEAEEGEIAPQEGEGTPAVEPHPETEEDGENAPEEEEEETAVAEKEEPPPEPPTPGGEEASDPPPRDGEEGRPAAVATGGVTGKVKAIEETKQPSPLASKPYAGLAPEPLRLDTEERKGYLPPIPLFKLFAGTPTKGALIDPDAINIVPEAYEEKYRGHIIAYFEKLQSLRGNSHEP